MTPRLRIASEQMAALQLLEAVSGGRYGFGTEKERARCALLAADALLAEHDRTRPVTVGEALADLTNKTIAGQPLPRHKCPNDVGVTATCPRCEGPEPMTDRIYETIAAEKRANAAEAELAAIHDAIARKGAHAASGNGSCALDSVLEMKSTIAELEAELARLTTLRTRDMEEPTMPTDAPLAKLLEAVENHFADTDAPMLQLAAAVREAMGRDTSCWCNCGDCLDADSAGALERENAELMTALRTARQEIATLEAENALRADQIRRFVAWLYENQPDVWQRGLWEEHNAAIDAAREAKP